MLQRRSRRTLDIRAPVEDCDAAVRLQDARSLAQHGIAIVQFMPDVGKECQVAIGGVEVRRRGFALTRFDVLWRAWLAKFGFEDRQHLRLKVDGPDFSRWTNRRGEGQREVSGACADVGD